MSICFAYAWNGELYSQSGTYEVQLTSVNGCDSTAILNLTILDTTSSSEEVTTCDSYEWNDSIYTQSGPHEFVTINSGGCDSTAILVLTLLSATDTILDITSCSSFEWNDSLYIESGVYTYDTLEWLMVVTLTATLNLTLLLSFRNHS